MIRPQWENALAAFGVIAVGVVIFYTIYFGWVASGLTP